MRHLLLFLLLSVPFLLALPLHASVVRAGEKVVIDQPSEGNHYLAGGEIHIEAPVSGDLFGLAGKIHINAPVGDDAMLAGGEIAVKGPIGGDLRVTGGKVTIESNIGGDLLIGGGEVIIRPGVLIGGDLLVGGGEVRSSGKIGGETRAAGGSVTFSEGSLQGLRFTGGELKIDAEVRGPARLSAESISLGENAYFRSDVEYWQQDGEIDFSPYLGEGATARFNPELGHDVADSKPGWMFPMYRFLAGAFLILLLIYLFAPFFRKHAGFLSRHLASSFGYGTAYIILVPILAVLAMITIIGIPIGLIMLAGYGITLLAAGALASVIVAYEIERNQGKDWSKGKIILIAIGISLLLRLLVMIPFLGTLVGFIVVAVALGYMYMILYRKYRRPSNPDIV